MNKNTFVTALLASTIFVGVAQAQVTPGKTQDFVGLMGVTSGFAAGNVGVSTGKSEMDYMGVKMFRDMCSGNPVSTYSALFAAGYKMVCTVDYGASVSGVVSAAKAIQQSYPGQLAAIEGMNEPGNFGFNDTGGGGSCGDNGINGGPYFSSGSVCATFMRNLYTAVKADSVLANIPVWGPTQTYFADSDVGLQWIADPNHPMIMDVSTVHPYLDASITVYDSLYPTTSVEIQAQHATPTYHGGFSGYSNSQLLQKSYAFTEAGCNLENAFCTTTYHRKMALKYWADAFLLNYKGAMVYQLHDGGGTIYGFFDGSGNARPAADDAHNLSAILAGGSVTPTAVNATFSGEGSSGHHVLLQNANGYWAMLWNENGSSNVTVNFGAAATAAPQKFDPQSGTSAVQTGSSGATSMQVAVPDYPVLVKFQVTGSPPPPPPPPPPSGSEAWSTTHKNSGLTIAEPTVNFGGTTGNDRTTFGEPPPPAGKWCWSIVLPTVTSGTGVGFGSTGTSTANGAWLGSTADAIGWWSDGHLDNNAANGGANPGAWGTFVSGNTEMLCMDTTVTPAKLWGRVNTGNWNASSTANPATGAGGLSAPSGMTAANIVPGVNLKATGQSATANWAPTGLPTGFSAIGSGAPPPGTHTLVINITGTPCAGSTPVEHVTVDGVAVTPDQGVGSGGAVITVPNLGTGPHAVAVTNVAAQSCSGVTVNCTQNVTVATATYDGVAISAAANKPAPASFSTP